MKFKHCEIINRAFVAGKSLRGVCDAKVNEYSQEICGGCTNEREFSAYDVVEAQKGDFDMLNEINAECDLSSYAIGPQEFTLKEKCTGGTIECKYNAGLCKSN